MKCEDDIRQNYDIVDKFAKVTWAYTPNNLYSRLCFYVDTMYTHILHKQSSSF